MNLTNKQIEKILDGAPDDTWTHYADCYLRELEDSFDYCCPEYGWMQEDESHVFGGVASRANLEEILTLRQRVQELEEEVSTAIEIIEDSGIDYDEIVAAKEQDDD